MNAPATSWLRPELTRSAPSNLVQLTAGMRQIAVVRRNATFP